MPYTSDAQRRFFHTATAKRKGISAATVKEYDTASKGVALPERRPKSASAVHHAALKGLRTVAKR